MILPQHHERSFACLTSLSICLSASVEFSSPAAINLSTSARNLALCYFWLSGVFFFGIRPRTRLLIGKALANDALQQWIGPVGTSGRRRAQKRWGAVCAPRCCQTVVLYPARWFFRLRPDPVIWLKGQVGNRRRRSQFRRRRPRPTQLQPLVAPQVSHFMQVPLRTSVKFPQSPQESPS